jgi:phosphatidylinositol-3-phosphatase
MKTLVLDGLERILTRKWRLGPWAAGLIALLSMSFCLAATPTIAAAAQATPKPHHVFIIVLENEGYDVTFGANSPALYLNALARKGALLKNYYGTGHNSLDNYIAMISGQAPNPVTQEDCQNYVDFKPDGPLDADGQAVGAGCIYPANVPTLAGQMEKAQGRTLTWKGYMEDMGNDANREDPACGRPKTASPDSTQHAETGDQYAARHNPFIYFHELDASCAAHLAKLSQLAKDLEAVETTPNFAFITPNLCNDGHDEPCVNDEPGGLLSADRFLATYVPKILNSPAFKKDGLLIVTFDEAEVYILKNKLLDGDVSACCDEPKGPNIHPEDTVFGNADKGPGIAGPGGGRIGAVLLSRYIREGTVSDVPYNHYSLLRSIEDFFDLKHLGYAGMKGLKPFGDDVFTQPSGSKY